MRQGRSSVLTYRPQLDGVRALAVTAVLLSHTWSGPGHQGVQLFFVLSGFLITGILLDSAETVRTDARSFTEALRSFYWHRLLRIAPPYYLLLFTFCGIPAFGVWHEFWYHALFLSNFRFAFLGAWQPAVLAPTWSLAIEQQFYLAWPVVMFALPKRTEVIAFGMIVSAVIFRFEIQALHFNEVAMYVLPPASFDALALGALLASRYPDEGFRNWLEGVAAVCAVVVMAGEAELLKVPESLWFPVFELLWPVVFVGLLSRLLRNDRGILSSLLSFRPLVSIGRISYSVYLVHESVNLFAVAVHHRMRGARWEPGFTRFAVVSLLSVMFAELMWRFVESPLRRYKGCF